MDRDEALRLLRGGAEGIEEWNRRRGTGEDLPNLSRTVLNGADLSGADLSGAILARADLTGAILDGAILAGAILNGAILAGACVLAAPVIALFVVFQRHFTASDIGSGVKG